MFIHLHLHSPYSFLDGASDLEALVRRAAEFGMPALALTDHDTLAGAVRFAALCTGYGIQPLLGAEVTLDDGTHLTLLAQNRMGYSTLCRLLSRSYACGGRRTPALPWAELPHHTEGLFCLTGCPRGRVHSLTRAHRYAEAKGVARQLRDWFGAERTLVELQDDFTPDCHRVCRELVMLAGHLGLRPVVTNNVHYATRRDFVAQDVLRCIGAGITTGEVHPVRPLNFERYLKSGPKMAELFWWCPEALANTVWVAERCEPALPTGLQVTPPYATPDGHDSDSYLRHLAFKGAKVRYKRKDGQSNRVLAPRVVARLEHELMVITHLGYADYFLMAWKLVRWTRHAGIRCTGRGSAADSCVAYSLFLTDVDVLQRNLPFARFLVPGKTPDIDLDFDAQRRDEVFRHLQEEYGADRVAMACTFHTYLAKSALRDVGKALGLPEETLKFFSKNVSHFLRADRIEDAFSRYPELKPHAAQAQHYRLLFNLCRRIAGFPRHIGTHSSGVVVSRVPLAEIAPVQPTARGVMPLIQLDKDDAEAVGLIKLDVLSLRILSAVEDATRDVQRHTPRFRYEHIPEEDEETYRMVRAGKAMGSFQLESPAQMALACVLGPQHFEDLVASVALIRPGPIRSHAVQRFVACRNGWARIDRLHPALDSVLAKTYGCVIFQEQVIQVIAIMIGCSEAEADSLRKRLARHAKLGTLGTAQEEFLSRTCARHSDLSVERAQLIWQQIETWGGYGFTEGHAASFAQTAYKSAYLSWHHAAEYYAAMMSNMPMGYYNCNTLAAEARRRGVQIRPVDINRSAVGCLSEGEVEGQVSEEWQGRWKVEKWKVKDLAEREKLEVANGEVSAGGKPEGLRLGFCLVDGLRREDAIRIVKEREEPTRQPYVSLLDFCARVPLHRDSLENLVLCGAFDALHPHRRGLLWRLDETIGLARTCRAARTQGEQTALAFGHYASLRTPIADDIPEFSAWDAFLWEWRLTGVAPNCHPFAHFREALRREGVLTCHEAQSLPPNTPVTVAGLNLRPHRPPTRSGRSVLFTSIEDETDILQTVCLGEPLEACTPVFLLSPAVKVTGQLQRRGTGASLLVERVVPFTMQEPAFDRFAIENDGSPVLASLRGVLSTQYS